MILIGTVTINMTSDTGVFYCPTCESEQAYKLKTKRQFLTLYFVPLIPMGSEGQFVQCTNCGEKHEVDVLSYNPEAEQQLVLDVIRQAMVFMLVQCGQTSADDIDGLRQLMFDLFEYPTDEGQVTTELEVATTQIESYRKHLFRIANQLPKDGKFLIIDGGVELLARDGILDESEKTCLKEMAQGIGLGASFAENSISQAKERLNIA